MSITWYGTPNFSYGNNGRLYIFVHICEGWWDGSISTLQNPARQASAHYVISGSDVAQLVSENDTAWHCGNYWYNRRSLSIELCGTTANPPSTETLDTCARLLADMSKRHLGGEKLVHGENIIYHREVYATSCPSTANIDYAVAQANTPVLDKLMATCPMTWLKAHGTAVGLPTDDDMGNSEVGHNALGCGQIYSQGAKLVQESIETGSLYQSKTWVELTDNCLQNGKALHFIGLLSDGNVHSNISHLIAMLKKAREMGLKKVYCHILLDGRDVPATSALEYVDQLEAVLASLSDAEHEYKIASGGGRMVITMDRYEANWPMVEKGWRTHVQGEGRQFASAKEAIETYRAENPGMIDQDLLPFVIAKDGQPVAKIANGDSVILFNFRGDRAQEISLAFDRKDFDHFDRGDYTGVKFAGMLEYDGDLKIPMHYLVEPPVIRNTLTEVLCKAGVHEYAVSETQKYGHVTYFWNGNRSGKVDESLEDYAEVPSDVIPFEQAPAMKSVEITDLLVEAMASHKYQFLRCNYPNGDMVGHTGVLSAVITAMEAVDAALARVKEAADKYGYTLLVTADHGNADQMLETKKGKTSVRTAHSLNPVPFIIYDPDNKYEIKDGHYGLANVAPTIVTMMGLESPDCWQPSMI